MKKIISLALVTTMSIGILTGCGGTKEEPSTESIETPKQEMVLPEINAGDIRNEALSPEETTKVEEATGDIVSVTEVSNNKLVEDKRYIYDGGTWYFDQFNEEEQEIYLVIKETLENAAGKKNDYLEFNGITEEKLLTIYRCVLDDNPQLLIQNVNGESGGIKDSSGKVTGAYFNMKYDTYWDKVTVEIANAEIENKVKEIMKTMDTIEGDYYKILWLYNYLIKDIEYNHDLPWSGSAYGALLKKECSCEGISEAFEYILNLYGIRVIGISGISGFITPDGENIGGHKWNMVELDGDWYHFDVTWDINKDLSKFLPYTYFAVDEKDISFAHAPYFPELIPEANATKYNYYHYNDLIVKSYTDSELIRVGKKCYSLTPGYFSFKFKNQKDFIAAVQEDALNQWILKVIQANKLSKWQYLVTYNPDLQIIEFAIFDSVQDPDDYK